MGGGAAVEAFEARLRARLAARSKAGLRRAPVSRRAGAVDLTTNDTLGYAHDRELAADAAELAASRTLGTGASRLLGGDQAPTRALERRLAALSGREAALLFPSGYQANVGLVGSLVGRGDLVVSDALNHASLIDGVRLSGAERRVVPHGDLGAIEVALSEPVSPLPDGVRPRFGPGGAKLVVVESVYSMDGDLADLEGLCDLCDAHGAGLVVDEAHATGLWGARGSGRVEALGLSGRVLATVHTGGKALGASGAWIAGGAALVDTLVNHARSYIYSTGPAPAAVAGLEVATERLAAEPERRDRVHALADHLRAALRARGLDPGPSASPIVPVVLGSADRAMDVASRLRRGGFDVRAVRPPTVPAETSRVRLVVRATHDEATLDRVVDALVEAIAETDAESVDRGACRAEEGGA